MSTSAIGFGQRIYGLVSMSTDGPAVAARVDGIALQAGRQHIVMQVVMCCQCCVGTSGTAAAMAKCMRVPI